MMDRIKLCTEAVPYVRPRDLSLPIMDYLRTLGSAAVSSLVQKSGLNLPFSLGPTVSSLDGLCTLYDATKRVRGRPYKRKRPS